MVDTENSLVHIDQTVSFGRASGAVIEITKKATEPDAMAKSKASALPYAIWGPDNDQPQRIIDQNMQETTSAGALKFKIAAHFGKGLYWYRESISNGKEIRTPMMLKELPAEMQEFCHNNDLQNFQYGIVSNYEWHEFFPIQYICNAAYNKIMWVSQKRTKDIRIGKRNARTGEIPNFYLSALWPKPKEEQVAVIPAFDKNFPFEVANGIYKHGWPSVDKDYYPTPYWQSNLEWVRVAMKIPRWISSNIDNSVNIKYHVEIPEQYFIDLYPDKMFPESKTACREARKQAEIDIKAEIDKCLAGADNAQKIFYTKFATDPTTNQPRPGWKINVLNNEMQDGAWLNADATAAARISSAHSVNPSLTALVTGSTLNVGSGSDTREKFNVHMQLHTVLPRQKTLEWYDIVQRANKWPDDIKLGYRDLILDTLDNNKKGVEVEHEPTPTV